MEKRWPGDPRHPPSQLFLQLLINHRRPFTPETANLARRVGSLGWQDKVTLGGEPNFSRVNGFKRVNRAKSHHAEHEQVDISVP